MTTDRWDKKCDECDEKANCFGPGYALCPTHREEYDARQRLIGNERTVREGEITQTCPRWSEAQWGRMGDGDHTWDFNRSDGFRTCSYCGSCTPERFMESVRAGEPIGPTDKSYKAYGPDHVFKFYYQHLSDEYRVEFIQMWNDGSLKTSDLVRVREATFEDGHLDDGMKWVVVEARNVWHGALPFFMGRVRD